MTTSGAGGGVRVQGMRGPEWAKNACSWLLKMRLVESS